jgi:hypothetical protein
MRPSLSASGADLARRLLTSIRPIEIEPVAPGILERASGDPLGRAVAR